jgi:hypothetical protein
MVVGKDEPLIADYESGAKAPLFVRVLGNVVKKPVEKVLKRVLAEGIGRPLQPILRGDCLGCADVDDRRFQFFCQFYEIGDYG